jgi:hypothetical protein
MPLSKHPDIGGGLGYAFFSRIDEKPGRCGLLVRPSMGLQDPTDRSWADRSQAVRLQGPLPKGK